MTTCKVMNNQGQTMDILGPEKLDYHKVGKNNKFKIKKNKKVFDKVKETQCFMQQYLWKDNKWDVVSIGFIIGAPP